jgi:hypothetical protein
MSEVDDDDADNTDDSVAPAAIAAEIRLLANFFSNLIFAF